MSMGEILFLALVLAAFTAFAATLAYYTTWSSDIVPVPEPAAKETPKPAKPAAKSGAETRVLEHA